MPRRRQKRTDTQNSDDYQEDKFVERVTHFGAMQMNRLLAPDQIEGDDASKYSVKVWSNTLYAQRLLPWPQRKSLFQRALNCLPYSYKIWYIYLTEFIDFCSTRSLISKEYRQLNQTFQRALQKLPKMPRIWLMYCQCLSKQQLITQTRSAYNWSFRNLPLTQHQRIWHKFSLWSMTLDNTSTAMKIIPRYLKLNPDFKENYAQFLKQRGFFNLYIQTLQEILKDEGYHSKAGKTKEDFFMEIIDQIVEQPMKTLQVNGQEIIRQGIKKFYDKGKLWVKLSDFFIRLGQFEKARDSLEQALQAIDNVKDQGIIFSAYCKFQEQMITALANQQIQQDFSIVESDNVNYQIEKRFKKLENLIQRQPYLLHTISLRRNPNNVKEWISLVMLYKSAGNIKEALKTLQEGIVKIEPQNVTEGRLSQIWIEYSKIYQEKNNINQCNIIFNKAINVNYKMIEDYANIWICWTETLLEEGYQQDALSIVKHVLFRKKPHLSQQMKIKNIDELLKSTTALWQLYIDLQFSLGNFQRTKIAYQRCKQHRCLTPIMLINFTNFLWEHAYFEECFRVFEFAVGNFKWPSLYQIWIAYITKFISRYSQDGIGIERTRSIFERLLKDAPIEKCGIFYFMYAEFQEKYGLYSHAIQIYDRMINSVSKEQKYQAYNIYISKVSKLLGVTKTRAIFESALQKLTQKQVINIGLKYAELETNLGQIQRARGIYTYIGQFTDPKYDNLEVWQKWKQFEVEFGNKQTYKEYLRINRSVGAKYAMLPPDLQKIEEDIKKGLI